MKLILPLLIILLNLCNTGMSQQNEIPEENWNLARQFLESQKDLSAILVLGSNGKIKINQGAGYSDRELKVPFTDQTLMTIGSITKPFTATAILLLLDRGKLTVEDSISSFFDNVPADKRGITLHQLLTHTSGLPGAIGDDYEAISDEAFQMRAWQQPLLFRPGTDYNYSNVGYSLLGMIIEKVSHQSYSEFLQENIFKPAGMNTAGYFNSNADYKLLAHGYTTDGQDWGTSHDKLWNGHEPYWHLKSNGGLLMSAQDMYHWYLALRENKVLSPAMLKKQITPYADEGGGSYYGYGYALDQEGECVQHNGGNRIFKADFRWFPKSDVFLFSATNDANQRLFRLNDQIIRILLTGELPVQDNWVEIPLEAFPVDEDQYAAKAFMEMIQSYTAEKADVFIPEYCNADMIDRNGPEKLHALFSMLHEDVLPESLQAAYSSGQKIKIAMLAREGNARIKITLTLAEHKISSLEAEIEGM